MILTGMIPSEMAGLREEDIDGEFITLNKSYVLGKEKASMKTAFRKRQIFIIETIRTRLDVLSNRTISPYLVTTPRGTRLNSTDFAKAWKKGVDQAGLAPMTSYSASIHSPLGV